MVPVVLPLLHGPSHAGGGPAADPPLARDAPAHPPDRAQLRTGRPRLPATPAPGPAPLGLRQPQDLTTPITSPASGREPAPDLIRGRRALARRERESSFPAM